MFCTSCGKELKAESIFCTSCGHKIETVKSEQRDTENKPRWKKIVGGVVGALAFLIAYGAVRYATQESISPSSSQTSNPSSIEQALVEASKETNKQLPMMVDSATQLSTTMASGKDFIYSYRLIGKDYASVTQSDINDSLREGIVSGACTTPETKKMLEEQVRLIYRYSNENGKYLGEVPVVLANCN